MKKLFCLMAIICSSVSNAQIVVAPQFYGQNYWYTDHNFSIAAAGTDLPNWSQVKESGAKLVRVGGEGYNSGTERPPTPLGYVKIVDYIRSQGHEPMIQVPLDPASPPTISSTDINIWKANAAEIVRLLNVVHKREVKYFIIGNEPGIDYGLYTYEDNTLPVGPDDIADLSDATVIANYLTQFSTVMKDIDPGIKIIGPGLEFNIGDLTTEFFGGGADLTGTISTGKGAGLPIIDYFSYHQYAGYGSISLNTRDNYILDGYNQHTSFSVSGLPSSTMGLMVDEFNLASSTASTHSTAVFSDVSAPNANSFIGGQYLIDMMIGIMNSGATVSNL